MTDIHLSILTNALLQLVAALILALGSVGVARLTRWLGIKSNDAARAAFDDVLQKSVTYGLQQTQEMIRRKGWDDLEVKTTALGHAAPYVERFPDVLKALKVDRIDRSEVQRLIEGALERAYPQAAAMAAVSPAAPPTTAPMPSRQADRPALEHALQG